MHLSKKFLSVSLATVGLLSSQLPALAEELPSLKFDSEGAETRKQEVDVNLALDSGGGAEFAIAEESEWNAEEFADLAIEAGVARKKPAAPRGGRSAPRGGHSSTYGNNTFYSKGGHSSTYGDNTFYSRGGHSSTYGSNTFYSGGGHSSTYGSNTFYSDGSHSSTYGNTTFFSKGGHCSVYGGNSFCS